jgi:hypothetical protein
LALSISRRQQNFLNSGFIDLNGSSRADFRPIDLSAITGTLVDIAIDFITRAQDRLEQADRISSAELNDSIVPTEVEIFGNVYSIGINVADYYKFIDKGVKGWGDAQVGGDSPYQFKKPSGKGSGRKSAMVTAVRKWIIKEGLKGKAESPTKAITPRARRRAAITDSSTRAAITAAYFIKKKGIEPSNFWTDTVNDIDQRIRNEIGRALKIDLINNIK